MDILRVRALVGANVWSRCSVLEVQLALTAEEQRAGDELLAAERCLRGWLSGWSPAPPAADPATRVAAALRGVTLALEAQVQGPGGRGYLGRPLSPGRLDIALEYQEEALSRACLATAQRLFQAALQRESCDVPAEVARLRALAEDVCLGRATGPLVAVARARDIPFRRLDGESLVQLGHGARRRRIRTSVTERTGKLAEWLSLDKALCKHLLAEVGVPVPAGRRVDSAEQAWDAACALGLPVVVKPASADYGHGIGLNLTTREQIEAAYAAARAYRAEVLVERFVPGEQYRVTVVNGKVVAAVRREPVRLLGDGEHTVAELMAMANRDPRRGEDLRLPLTPVSADDDTEQMLEEQGLALDARVPAGREVVLSRIAHSWAGAGVTDVTDQLHPAVAAQCVRAVRLLGLDVAGVDLVSNDIARPLGEQDGAILEVKAEPTIAFHFPPLGATHRPVCEAILASLFPDGQTGRIPLAVVSGSGERAIGGRILAGLLGAHGLPAGRASAEGLWLGPELVKRGDQSNVAGTLAALLLPESEAAVLERDLQGFRDEGLGVDRVDAVLLTGLDAAGEPGRQGELAGTVVALLAAVAAHGAVIIPADDPTAATLVASFQGRMVAFGGDGTQALHARRAALFLRGRDLVFRSREGKERVLPLGEDALIAAANRWLGAAAAAWAMGVPEETIRTQLPPLLRQG